MINSNKRKNFVSKFCIEKLRLAEREAELISISEIEQYLKSEKHLLKDIELERKCIGTPNYD